MSQAPARHLTDDARGKCDDGSRGSGTSSTLSTSQDLPVIGNVIENMNSVCSLVLWALASSFINGRGWKLFLWLLGTCSSIPFYVCSEFFLFWLLTSSPVHHQPREHVLCCVGTSALPSPGAVSRREFLKPRSGRISNDTAPGWCTVTGLAVTIKFLEKCPWAVVSSLTVRL